MMQHLTSTQHSNIQLFKKRLTFDSLNIIRWTDKHDDSKRPGNPDMYILMIAFIFEFFHITRKYNSSNHAPISGCCPKNTSVG